MHAPWLRACWPALPGRSRARRRPLGNHRTSRRSWSHPSATVLAVPTSYVVPTSSMSPDSLVYPRRTSTPTVYATSYVAPTYYALADGLCRADVLERVRPWSEATVVGAADLTETSYFGPRRATSRRPTTRPRRSTHGPDDRASSPTVGDDSRSSATSATICDEPAPAGRPSRRTPRPETRSRSLPAIDRTPATNPAPSPRAEPAPRPRTTRRRTASSDPDEPHPAGRAGRTEREDHSGSRERRTSPAPGRTPAAIEPHPDASRATGRTSRRPRNAIRSSPSGFLDLPGTSSRGGWSPADTGRAEGSVRVIVSSRSRRSSTDTT